MNNIMGSAADRLINCVLFNARSLMNKIELLPLVFSEYKASIIFVTETWLKPWIPDSFMGVQQLFSMVRCDRMTTEGGGVCVFIKKELNYNVVTINDRFNILEIAAIDLILLGGKIRCIVCYRPPYYDDCARVYAQSLVECLNGLVNCAWPCIVLGDFNLPLINWKDNYAPNSHIYLEFFDFVTINGFTQVVDSPTREENILDLVLCNDQMLINDCVVTASIIDSDHNTIVFNLSDSNAENKDVSAPSITVKDFKSADFDALNNYLAAVDWQAILANIHDVQVMWDVFTAILDEAINLFVPVRVVNLNRRTDLRSYPKYIRRLFSQKLSAWRVYRKFRTEPLKQKYYAVSRKCQCAVDLFVKKKENALIENGGIGEFYRYVNNKISNRAGVAALKCENDDFITDDLGKAEKLNKFFGSVFTVDNNIIPSSCNSNAANNKKSGNDDDNGKSNSNNNKNNNIIDDVDFSVDEVYKALFHLKPKFSSGPDGYCAYFLKNIAAPIAFPLTLLFSQSLCSSEIPAVWRQAIVTPAFKKGKPSEPNNYRPISLTCICCKVMESVIKKQVLTFLLAHGKITKQQHGFLAKHSTCSQIIECINDWSLALNIRKQVDVVYIDFCKAFDSVVHSKLIYKLEALGIRGKLLLWVAAFLSDRTQVVRVGKAVSGSIKVISGVPQGSVLGPLLFLVYINDIVNIFDSKVQIKLFADDVKIYVVIDDLCDCILLQNYLNRLVDWASQWQLKVSVNKCAALHLGPSRTNFKYNIESVNLPDVVSIVDLGVIVNNKLKFKQHINGLVSKAHQRASLILRCFKCRDPATLCRAFVVYVRPIVEYCSQVWSPVYLTDIHKIERVQRRFTRRLRGMQGLSYSDRLSKLQLETLELRRLKFDLIMVFKILKGFIDIRSDIFEFSSMLNLRGHNCKLRKPPALINCRYHSFTCRVVDTWNFLPQCVVDAPNVQCFKHALNSVNFNSFLSIKL